MTSKHQALAAHTGVRVPGGHDCESRSIAWIIPDPRSDNRTARLPFRILKGPNIMVLFTIGNTDYLWTSSVWDYTAVAMIVTLFTATIYWIVWGAK